MDIEKITVFLKESVLGIVILGALGSAIFYYFLNILGKTNQGIRWLWTFYKEGRKKSIEEMVACDLSLRKNQFMVIFLWLLIISLVVTHIWLDLSAKKERSNLFIISDFIVATGMLVLILGNVLKSFGSMLNIVGNRI